MIGHLVKREEDRIENSIDDLGYDKLAFGRIHLMEVQTGSQENRPFSARVIVVSLAFGGVALVVVLAELFVPIPGTGVVTDPREIFTTLGAALTGPVGGLIIGVLAGIGEAFIGSPAERIPLASLLAHVAGGVWMGWAYKKLVFNHLQMPALVLGWAAIVAIFYFVFAIPGFVIGQLLFYPEQYAAFYGEGASLIEAYLTLSPGVVPEVLITVIITSLVMVALPRRYRRPLW